MKCWSLCQLRREGEEAHLIKLGQASCNVNFTHMRSGVHNCIDLSSSVGEGLVIYGLLPIFVNKVLLAHSHAFFFMHCLWQPSCCNSKVELTTRPAKP